MKYETEQAIRSIVSCDTEVTGPNLNRAIRILYGEQESEEDLVHVMRYKDVCELLHVHPRTLEYYINRGYLDRVYGMGGMRALGITRESFIRFTTERVVVRNIPSSGKSRASEGAVTKERKLATGYSPNTGNRRHKYN